MFALPEIVGLAFILLVLIALGASSCRSAKNWPERLKVVSVFSPILMFCICSIAWLVGGAIAIKHGGYTYNGKIENGIHYLRYKSKFTAVSEETWEYLEWIERWTGGWTFALGVFCMGILFVASWLYNRNAGIVGRTPDGPHSNAG